MPKRENGYNYEFYIIARDEKQYSAASKTKIALDFEKSVRAGVNDPGGIFCKLCGVVFRFAQDNGQKKLFEYLAYQGEDTEMQVFVSAELREKLNDITAYLTMIRTMMTMTVCSPTAAALRNQ